MRTTKQITPHEAIVRQTEFIPKNMKDDVIKITIEGCTGSGKTILAHVLKEFIEEHGGLPCKIYDDADPIEPLPRNWKSQFRNVKNKNIEISTKQTIRHCL